MDKHKTRIYVEQEGHETKIFYNAIAAANYLEKNVDPEDIRIIGCNERTNWEDKYLYYEILAEEVEDVYYILDAKRLDGKVLVFPHQLFESLSDAREQIAYLMIRDCLDNRKQSYVLEGISVYRRDGNDKREFVDYLAKKRRIL